MDLPEGFTEGPPADLIPSKANTAPVGFTDEPSLPMGFSASPPPPEGFTNDNPAMPPTGDPQQKTNTEMPGYLASMGSAYGRGLAQNVADAVAGGKAILPDGVGGKSLEQQYQEGTLHPETKDGIDNLLNQGVFQGWTDPKWWLTRMASGVGGMTPGLGAGAVGTVLGGPIGAGVGFTGEIALSTLPSAYKAARATGLDPDAAMHRALIDTGIAGAGAAAMAIAPGFSLFGRVSGDAAAEAAIAAATAFKRPALEAIAQLGVVQPLIGDTQHIATSLTHGETPGTEDLITTHLDQMAVGGVMVGAHAAMRGLVSTGKSEPVPIAPPEAVNEAFKNQQTVPGDISSSPSPQTEPTLSALDETLYPRESRVFFSKMRQVVDEHLPDSASIEQVIATLRNKGVKEEEMLDHELPSYLASVDGKVSKADLQAHLDANSVVLEEARGGNEQLYNELKVFHNDATTKYGRPYLWPDSVTRDYLEMQDETTKSRGVEYPGQVLPGEHSNYREFVLKVPPRGEPIVNEFKGDVPKGWQTAGGSISETRLDPSKNYENSHWPQDTNPIAHIRVSDRSDHNGRNLLHVEEIQSDVHQEGRKVGYRDPKALTYDQVHAIRRPINEKLNERLRDLRDQGVSEFDRMDDPEVIRLRKELDKITPAWQAAVDSEHKVPDLPFKTTWDELAVKRILRLAADEGYDGVSWSNGEQVGIRLGTEAQLRGAREFYDKKITSLFGKWAKKLGSVVGETRLYDQNSPNFHPAHEQRLVKIGLDPYKINDRNKFVEINPAFSDRVRMGLPLYEEGIKTKRTLSESFIKGMPKELIEPGKKIVQALGQIGKDMKLSRDMTVLVRPSAAKWRGKARLVGGKYQIEANTRLLRTSEDVYATLGHELGHLVYWDKFAIAPDAIKTQVLEQFRQFKMGVRDAAQTVGDVRRVRDNAISEQTGSRNPSIGNGQRADDVPLSDLTPKSKAYLLHFEEWFAEQVSKWATTSERPLSRLDKFYSDIGKTIRGILEKFQVLTKKSGQATEVMQKWLDSMITDMAPFASDIKDKLDLDTLRMNQEAMSRDGTPEVVGTPLTASTGGGRNILDALGLRSDGGAGAAHADRMNRFYEWMLSLPQIAELNKHIRPLTMYKEAVALMNLEKNNIMGAAAATLKEWKAMRNPEQQVKLGKFIDDYMNGMFKDPSDMSGTVRRPNKKEFSNLVQKHGLGEQALRIFNQLVKDFDGTLEHYRQLLLEDAGKIKDPIAQQKAMESANRQVDNLLSRPYFPAMRFGKYNITVYDSAGNVRHYEQTESLRKQKQIAEALGKSVDLLPGDRVRTGEVPKDAAPLLGMPSGLLDLLDKRLELSSTQRQMLDQLRFDYAPSQSFRHQFRTKDLTPGYSTDWQRAYANFFFHGANHMTRIKYVDQLRDRIREIKEDSINLNDGVKRDQIANYMTQHLNMLVDPKPDFAALRGLMFHWYLGFNPASATLNLSQTALMTFPHLASKFGGLGIGDMRAAGALARAGTDLNNFYKKGNLLSLGTADPKTGYTPTGGQRALAEAVREGVISETQAHTLAAVSENRNLLRAFGSKGEELWQNFSEASSWMFEMTEQYNRRVAFRAAWDLAMRDPNNKYVSETVRDNPLQYERLKKEGWSHQEAAAFTAAKHTTEATQFVYAPYSRPKFMWGRKGALFIFKSFTQNTLFNLYNNPAGAARTLLILGGLGGLMGLPGTEDVNGILKGLAWRLFGKDFDLEDEVRKFAVDILHGAIGPDMLLHGMSTKGFGIPAVLNALGGMVGLPRFAPTLDRHGSVSMGNILPFEPGKLFGPTKDTKSAELQQIQRASGAGFSNIFALYNFLNNQNSLKELKRWEMIMPHAASNLSHAWRWANEGMEKSQAGNAIVKFDVNDTEQMAEILARAAGYQPRRLTAQYEKIQGQQEATTYWDLRKQILLRQLGAAMKGGNEDEKGSVMGAIKNYNNELPDEAKAKRITSQTVHESVIGRMKSQQKLEAGLPTAKQNYGLFKSLDTYYPEAKPMGIVGIRPVK